MSIGVIRHEIFRFLASSTAEVLCVSGKWGVGKTHSWKNYLKEARTTPDGIALKKYAYVSLFGINSLEELKYSIFENTVVRDKVGDTANFETLKSSLDSAEDFGRKSAWLLNLIPGVRTYFSAASPALFLTVQKQIICLDDIERRGQKLDIADVLGLISFLKEERGCKIVLLLNDGAFDADAKTKFERHLEKVVDVYLEFNPSAAESASIAIPGNTSLDQRIAEKCIALDINNIRIIKKAERVVRQVEPLLRNYDDGVLEAAIAGLTLFVWSLSRAPEAPTIDFLVDKRAKSRFGLPKEAVPPEELKWGSLLDSYNFSWLDEFDLILLESAQSGIFDFKRIEPHATVLNEKIIAARADSSFDDAWRAYSDSFANDQAEVLDRLYNSFMSNFKHITPINLSGIAILFKDLGRPEQATQMISQYISGRNESADFFDLSSHPLRGHIADEEVVAAFKAKHTAYPSATSPTELMLGLKENWNDETLRVLARIDVDEYYRIFKNYTGKDLRAIMSGIFQFSGISNASEDMLKIMELSKLALKRIGRESPINARRVKRFGVDVSN